ncbi:uncharacterized protein LOC119837183 [Zerene cesonia]|uniref:uncharacterized protein LOC119837183 n=1 Tax=Zerene cesonia TaxID=33412 RepID=UPI0018E57BFB|nr:uncharacterized protein LOC119837183 [Zerene cesonia]
MDISKYLKNVKTLDDYNITTQDFVNKYCRAKIRLNMSAVLALKTVRSLEIEYFNKNGENGVAVHIFKNILDLPGSKTWGLLGKELISVLKYWFDTLRLHLLQHNNWWNFLNLLLKFVKEIRIKDSSINQTIIEELSDNLLHLAIHRQPSTSQRLHIIQCFNICSAESNREIRIALRNKFEQYFWYNFNSIKLSELLSQCGDFRLQYSMLESLMRWLLPRQELSVRKKAAEAWFTTDLYSQNAVDIFLNRTWMNFFKDARDFLNAQNDKNELITSVQCKKFVIGSLELITVSKLRIPINIRHKKYWLDLNTGNKNLSLMLELKLLEILKAYGSGSNALVITEDNVTSVKMLMESSLIKIELHIKDSKQLHGSDMLEGNEVMIYIGPENAVKVNTSLAEIFEDKYQILLDLNKIYQATTENARECSQIENSFVGSFHSVGVCYARLSDFFFFKEDTRFSNPIKWRRRKHSGVITRSGRPVSLRSPASSASTSSLALLREKLSELPGCQFEREPVSVCALPQLSRVTEVTEIDESRSFNDESTFRPRTFGVALKNKSDSDHATVTSRRTVSENNNLSPPNNHDENSISCLLVATIGSADSVINDTLDRFPKGKEINTDNIVDMLVKEALQSNRTLDRIRENTKNIRTESIEKSPNVKSKTKQSTIYERNENNNIVQRLGDEQTTDCIEDTPNHVFPKHRKEVINSNKVVSTELDKSNKDFLNNNNSAFDSQIVEDFFAQHCHENKNEDVILSPSLAKKINETSSESSGEFDLPTNNDLERDFNFNEIEIVECLNDLVDQVCEELDNYIKMQSLTNDVAEAGLQNNGADESDSKATKKKTKIHRKSTSKAIKLKFKSTMKHNKKQYKSTLQIETDDNMSTVHDEDCNRNETNNNKSKSPEISQIRRKRKLYSPNDEHIINAAKPTAYVSESEKDDVVAPDQLPYSDTPKSKATSYKEIEQIKRSTRRIIKHKKMSNETPLSPRSKKINDDFNNLKKTVDNNENITLVDAKRDRNLAVYNFSSDSDDSDFKKKFTQTFKRTPSVNTTTRSRRNVPRKNYSEKKPREKKTKSNSKQRERDTIKISRHELLDEKMREPASETLNASITIEVPQEKPENLEPNINIVPQMEAIDEQVIEKSTKNSKSKRKTKRSKKKDQCLKSDNELTLEVRQEKEESVSPLPALIVESQPKDNNLEDSVMALEKLQEMCENDSIGKQLQLNTTQNLLSDVEQTNSSPQNLNVSSIQIKTCDKSTYKTKKSKKRNSHKLSTSDKPTAPTDKEGSLTDNKMSKKAKNRRKRDKRRSKSRSTDSDTIRSSVKHLKVSAVIEHESPKSIPTLGKSPITGHGNSKEKPPSSNQLEQNLQPRDLEVEYLDDSIKEYHKTLTDETHKLWHSNNSDKASKVSKEDARRIVRNSPAVSVTRLSTRELREWVPPRHNSIFGSDQSEVSKQSRSEAQKEATPVTASVQKPILSIISPIKLFATKPISISDGGNVNKAETISSKSAGNESKSKYDFRKRKNVVAIDSTPKRSKLESAVNTSSPIISSKPTTSAIPQYRMSDDVVANVSVPSRSVSFWMKQNQSILSSLPPENYETFMYRDNLNLIIEKLNTTLVEIQHDTSRRFGQLFVEVQRQLKEASDSRHHLFRVTGCDMLEGIMQIIDYKFKELDARCRAMDEQIRNNFKLQTCAVLREDSKKKRLFVKLLKQDIRNMFPSQ